MVYVLILDVYFGVLKNKFSLKRIILFLFIKHKLKTSISIAITSKFISVHMKPFETEIKC